MGDTVQNSWAAVESLVALFFLIVAGGGVILGMIFSFEHADILATNFIPLPPKKRKVARLYLSILCIAAITVNIGLSFAGIAKNDLYTSELFNLIQRYNLVLFILCWLISYCFPSKKKTPL